MKASPNDSLDRGLFEVITQKRARDRKSLVKTLAIETKPATDTSKATILALRMSLKAVRHILSRKKAKSLF